MEKNAKTIRAPYSLLACDQLDLSQEEISILCAVDTLIQRIRKAQLSGTTLDINRFVQAHVENAEEYYSTFSIEDMLKLDMLSMISKAVLESLEDESV